MYHFEKVVIDKMERLYRNNLINSCSGFKSANLIATQSLEQQTNIGVFSSVTHFGSNPPIYGFVMRPTTVPRHTYENIKATGFYTINHIHLNILEAAHQCSAKYDQDISEFQATGLQEEYKEGFLAPFVQGCPIQVGMKFLEEVPIKANGTILILGEIQHLFVDKNLLSVDGFVDLAKGSVASINGLDGYGITSLLKRFEYARPQPAHVDLKKM